MDLFPIRERIAARPIVFSRSVEHASGGNGGPSLETGTFSLANQSLFLREARRMSVMAVQQTRDEKGRGAVREGEGRGRNENLVHFHDYEV